MDSPYTRRMHTNKVDKVTIKKIKVPIYIQRLTKQEIYIHGFNDGFKTKEAEIEAQRICIPYFTFKYKRKRG